jgi:MinD-like ATPase involved in chromosome partitioning or flagellar assembly
MTAIASAVVPTYYRSTQVDGLTIAYREAGDPGSPKLVLLHGFPASSHQYRDLIPALATRFHVIAPDYPGFGNSDMPDPATFAYTFDRISEIIETFLIDHSSGIRVLLAPPSPETAEMITAAGVKKVLESLRMNHDLVVVDCTAFFNDTTLAVLDSADVILTMLSLEITSIKNMRLFLEVAEQLGYEKGKVRLVLNRADSALGIRVADVEHSIGRKVDETVVSDGRSVVYALNRGVPFFLSNREAQVSQDILRLARSVVGGQAQPDTVDAGKSTQKKSLFAWR